MAAEVDQRLFCVDGLKFDLAYAQPRVQTGLLGIWDTGPEHSLQTLDYQVSIGVCSSRARQVKRMLQILQISVGCTEKNCIGVGI